jgi:hypothetical protein
MSGTVERRNHGRGHSYRVDGAKIPGVTTILSQAMPKPALVNWAGNVTAEYAIDRWAELAELPPSKRLAELKGARFADRDRAANRGTEVHALAEKYVAGVEVEIPEEIEGHVRGYEQFVADWEPEPLAIEVVVINRATWYAGTADLIARLCDGHTYLLDVKTSRSGIYPETALQLTAYARAETYCTEVDGQLVEHPMKELGIDRVAAIWVRPDGYELRRINAGDEVWAYYRHLAWLYRQAEDVETWVGPAIPARKRVSA